MTIDPHPELRPAELVYSNTTHQRLPVLIALVVVAMAAAGCIAAALYLVPASPL